MDDLDFLIDQINCSNATSPIDRDKLRYAMVDLGWAYAVPETV